MLTMKVKIKELITGCLDLPIRQFIEEFESYIKATPPEFTDTARITIQMYDESEVHIVAYYHRPFTNEELATAELRARKQAAYDEHVERSELARLKQKYESK
jgi:hypothetical protein